MIKKMRGREERRGKCLFRSLLSDGKCFGYIEAKMDIISFMFMREGGGRGGGWR